MVTQAELCFSSSQSHFEARAGRAQSQIATARGFRYPQLVGPPAQEAIPLLSGWATNADGSVRSYAINALGRIRAEPERGLPVLINALNDADLQIRTAALMALQGLGPNAKPALPVLVEFLSNAPSGIEWTCASNALKAIDPEAAAKACVK